MGRDVRNTKRYMGIGHNEDKGLIEEAYEKEMNHQPRTSNPGSKAHHPSPVTP